MAQIEILLDVDSVNGPASLLCKVLLDRVLS